MRRWQREGIAGVNSRSTWKTRTGAQTRQAVPHVVQKNGHQQRIEEAFQVTASQAIRQYLEDNDLLEPVDQ